MFHSAWPPSRRTAPWPAFASGKKLRADDLAIRNAKPIEKPMNRIHVMHERRAIGAGKATVIVGIGQARHGARHLLLLLAVAAAISSGGTSSPWRQVWCLMKGQASGSFTSTDT